MNNKIFNPSMAKKKTRKMVQKKINPKLESRFDCPICNHENVVQCKINSKFNSGVAACSACNAHYGCKVTNLDNPIDIYYSWIDEVNSKH